MFARCLLAGFLGLCVCLSVIAQEKKPDEKKKDEPRKGTLTGILTAKGENWVEVKADGEEKARRYVVGRNNPTTLQAIKEISVESRIQLDWAFGESLIAVKVEVLKKGGKDDTKKPDKKDEARMGMVTGVVTAKGDNWIEVKADGEEKARRYVPHWKGGAPAAGGGPDKDMIAEIKKVTLNSRVELKWVFEERPRVEKITILKKGEEKK